MPSYGMIEFVTNFVMVPERADWVGLDVGCGELIATSWLETFK